jgi:integrase
MALDKQAKTLSRGQIEGALGYVATIRHPHRNRVIVLLSVKAGFRAKEIASLTWDMVTDASGEIGDAIHLRDIASKGRSGRGVPLNRELKRALERFPFRRTISRICEVCSAFRSRDLIKTRGDGLAEAPDGERGILQSICGHFAQERLEFGE